ncbi:MAG: hypothetical protein OZSIB_1999 [Candidatus Ozemobacter sibiricus]|jgi:ribosomal protein S27E|uniref:Zinc-ribbon domain-containing protein n=1 Tax=Candidatus Ozemobacter sibiricus TaxID=2268124 RepID=A0A367ZKR3_9BACT|nr:MAG: hypothetical protein OZSIB_1999 [Candidatus Ozemobacter sibiricus]
MKRTLWLALVSCVVAAVPAMALFCVKCGTKLPETARFCSSCGAKVVAPTGDKPSTSSVGQPVETGKPARPTTNAVPSSELSASGDAALSGVYRTKTDLYIYERRGDEHNVLKKNLFFKPRRYKLPRNARFTILEYVGDTLLIQTVPEASGKILKGWVTDDELALRSDWVKKK